MFFQFSPIRSAKKPVCKEKETETIETLLLTPFSQIPKLFFDNVKIGDTAKQKLLIKNTTAREITVFIDLNIPSGLNVALSCNQITLPPNEEKILELEWCPSSEVSSRFTLFVEDGKKIKKEIPVAFKSVDLKKSKTGTKRKNPRVTPKAKSPTKKYYATKPPNISPKRFSPCKKISPHANKFTQNFLQRYPKKLSPKIVVSSPDLINDCSLQTLPKISNGKENKCLTSSRLMLNTSTDSNVFVSPNSAPFYLDHVKPAEQGRETYVLHHKNLNNPFASNIRRETYILEGKTVISPPSEFDDSLENNTPLRFKTRENLRKPPLGIHTTDNIMTTVNLTPRGDDFEYKLLQFESFCFSPLSTPVSRRQAHSSPLSSTFEKPKPSHITSVPNNSIQNNTYELPPNSILNVSGQTYNKEDNTSFETYVKGNLSGGTYTKDSSIGNIESLNLSPSFLKPPISPVMQTIENSTYNANRTIDRKQLSCIQEESFMPNHSIESIRPIVNMKRKSEIDFTFSPPKKPFIQNGPIDWSKRGGSAIRISRHTSGLNMKQFLNEKNTENLKPVAEITKTSTQKMIIQNPFLLAATNLVDPFMTPDLYVDQEWIDQQEIDFKKWLNALLSPPKEFESVEQAVDVAKVWQDCKKLEIEAAPTKEAVANQYHISNRLMNLRRAAQDLFRSEDVSKVLTKVYVAIDQGKLSIREDKDVHLNLSTKSDIMSVLLSYNTLWLRVGLETVFNEIIPLNSNSDIVGLSKFVVDRLFKDPYLIRKYKSVHNTKYKNDFNKFFLKKFLTLVYFLDQAKNKQLIRHDPCLFSKRAVVKSSREILLKLARELLSSVGDITKFLKFSGYIVTHEQTYIHEFDYAVINLGVDLRDGVRLTKVMEIILLKENLTSNLRVPAISRLQKIHNMKIVFESLKQAGYDILYDISPKDIVDGHREKTLSFLWQIIYKFEAPLMVKSATIIQRWFRSLPVVLKRRKLMKERLKKENAARTIQNWYRRNKLLQKLVQFTKLLICYLDMKKKERAAIKIQARFKMYICRKKYLDLVETVTSIQVRCRGWLVRNILRVQIQSAIIVQKYVRRYLTRKRYLRLKHAALFVQKKYRAKRNMRLARQHYIELKSAVVLIQQKFKANRLRKIERLNYQAILSTTIKIQQKFRANKLCKIERRRFLKIQSATVCIQTWFKSRRLMKICRSRYKTMKNSVLVIEQRYIAYKKMIIQRNDYKALKSATIFTQRKWRATRHMKTDYERYQKIKTATVCIQQKYRAMKLQRKVRKYFIELKKSAIIVQRKWRAQMLYREQYKTFNELKTATLLIQRRWRSNKLAVQDKNRYEKLKKSTLLIQSLWKAKIQGRKTKQDFINLKKATLLLQQKWRAIKLGEVERKHYLTLKKATITIQTQFKAKYIGNIERQRYINLKKAVIFTQQKWRAKRLGVQIKKEFTDLKKTTLLVQQKWRAKKTGLLIRTQYLSLKKATISIQSLYKAKIEGRKERQYYKSLKKTTLTLQQRWRANKLFNKERLYYRKLQITTIFIQRTWRANKICKIQRNNYLKLKHSTLLIQSKWKATLLARYQRAYYVSLKTAVIFIQRKWTANRLCYSEKTYYKQLRISSLLLQQKWRAKKLCRKERNEFVNLKNTTIFIQRRWRALKQGKEIKTNYTALRRATIILQQRWRARKSMQIERSHYETIKNATLILQRRYRANRAMKTQYKSYNELKTAAIFIQRRWRALKIGRELKTRYDEWKRATIIIQQKWKAMLAMKKEYQNYCCLKKAIILIQRKYKAKLLMRISHLNYMELKKATVFIQRTWRALKISKEIRSSYVTLRTTTIMIQQRWRATRAMRESSSYYSALKKATVTVQRIFRANNLMERQRSSYLKLKSSTIIIQRFYRGYKMMRQNRETFLLQKQAITKLQVYIRGFLVRRKYAYYFSTEAREQRKIEQIRKTAAIKIQAFWRGYKCRREINSAFKNIRDKLKKANEMAAPDKTLRWKSKMALQTITNEKSTLLLLIKALEDLDVATRHSKEICESIAKLLSEQLYLMISVLTRSLPEMNAAIASINLLITFYKNPTTRKYSFIPEHINSLITLMLHWCDKESMLFPITCTLIWLFAHVPAWKRYIISIPNFDQKFEKIHNLVSRKQNMVKKTGTKAVTSVFSPYKDLPMPNIKSDWGLNCSANPNTFTNSFHALSSLSKLLKP